MASFYICYGSTTGTTEQLARWIESDLKGRGHEVRVDRAAQASAQTLAGHPGPVLFGVSTWGFDEIVYQEDFESYLGVLEQVDLQGKRMGVFGAGDSSYPFFCGAVDDLAERLAARGAEVWPERFKVDGGPGGSLEALRVWVGTLAEAWGN